MTAKSVTFKDVEEAIHNFNVWSPGGPRSHATLWVAFLAGALAFALLSGFFESNGAVALVIVASSFLAGWLFIHFSNLPLTWLEDLEHKLASYEPVSTEAYKDLQEQFRTEREFTAGMLCKWLKAEKSAIHEASKQSVDDSPFLKRRA